jgi:hypothetical protein
MKIRETEVDILFEDILEKASCKTFDLKAFISVSNNCPEILDFFDIFNNKIMDSLSMVIQRETFKKIEALETKLNSLVDRTDKTKMRNFYSLTLSSKSFIDTSIRENQMLKNVLNAEKRKRASPNGDFTSGSYKIYKSGEQEYEKLDA